MSSKDTQTFEAHKDSLPHMLQWTEQRVISAALSKKETYEITLALEEVIVNILEHAHFKEKGEIILTCRVFSGRALEFEVCDTALAFNPLTHKSGLDPLAPLEMREIGGIGLFLIHHCTDAVFYRRESSKNFLTLVKNYHSSKKET